MVRTALTAAVAVLAATVGGWMIASAPSAAPTPPKPKPTWILHYQAGWNDDALASYDDLVHAAPASVDIVTVVGSSDDAAALRKRCGGAQARMQYLTVPGRVSPWARDRYVFFEKAGHAHCLVLPSEIIPEFIRGDTLVPEALRARHPGLSVLSTPYTPVGGDTIITDRRVLVGLGSIHQIAARLNAPSHAVIRTLEDLFGRALLVVGTAATRALPAHLDMFVGDAGRGRVVLSDPRLAHKRLQGAMAMMPGLGRFDTAYNFRLAAHLDVIADQLEIAGFAVHRVPGLFAEKPEPGRKTPTVLTYTNVLLEGDTAYVPAYGNAELDRAGRDVWKRLGYRCKPIRVEGPILNGGSVRCMTNRCPP